MSFIDQIDSFAKRLGEESDYKVKHSVISELSDVIESFDQLKDLEHYNSVIFPIYLDLLRTVPVSFNSSSQDHKLRNAVLEIINRSQLGEVFKYNVDSTTETLQEVLKTDNEENGVLALRILTSLFKNHKTLLSEKAEGLVDLIIEMYKNMAPLVESTFSIEEQQKVQQQSSNNAASSSEDEMNTGDSSSSSANEVLARSMHSFKIIAECPIAMVTITSTYNTLAPTTLPKFFPHIIDILKLEVPQQKAARELKESQNQLQISISDDILNRSAFGDFIVCQVKAMSFLSYLLIREHIQEIIQSASHELPDLLLRLLQDCPSGLFAARKELLHATRHILTTSYRTLFVPKLLQILNERVLLGDGLTTNETLKPLAYSIVADFVHNVRKQLPEDQILTTIEIYCGHLKDDTLSLTVQVMSAKLLLNLVERILKLPNQSEARQIFMFILDAFTQRFKSLNRQFDFIIQQHHESEDARIAKIKEHQAMIKKDNEGFEDAEMEMKRFMERTRELARLPPLELGKASSPTESAAAPSSAPAAATTDATKKDSDGDVDMSAPPSSDCSDPEVANSEFFIFNINRNLPILIHPNSTVTPLKEARSMVRTLLQFLKTISYAMRIFSAEQSTSATENKIWEQKSNFKYDEVLILRELFRESILGKRFFSTQHLIKKDKNAKKNESVIPSTQLASTKDEKELMEHFAVFFIHVDFATFNEIIQQEIEFLFEAILQDSVLLYIPQFLIANDEVTSNFLSVLIAFLMKKLPELGSADVTRCNVIIRLFKLCFMSLNLFPEKNESIILPHLNSMVLDSLKYTTTAKEPSPYFHLIRLLFRSIGGGRFENLYMEIIPFVQVVLEALNRLIINARKPTERDIYVELCLTVPVRLSVLVPHLKHLMRPLVLALQSPTELVSQGLRTLELCVDNLNAEYFDPIIEPVIDQVMAALWKHLKPLPYNHQHAHTTFRILGKLGGRNRRFIKPHDDLKTIAEKLNVKAKFKVEGMEEYQSLSITTGFQAALDILENGSMELKYRVSAFEYLSNGFLLFIPANSLPHTYGLQLKKAVELLSSDAKLDFQLEDEQLLSKDKIIREQSIATKLLSSLFYSVSIPEVSERALNLIKNITEHLTLTSIAKVLTDKSKHQRPFSVNDKEGKITFTERDIFESIIYALSSYYGEVRDAGIQAIKTIFQTIVTVCGSVEQSLNFSLLKSAFNAFIHSCYEETYYMKLAGVLGLKTLVSDLGIPIAWFKPRQYELIHCMSYVLKDTNPEAPCEVVSTAKQLILDVLKQANVGEVDLTDKVFFGIVSNLVYDLSNANQIVRETSQEALTILSTTTGVSIAKLMDGCKHILLSPIFGKPLRALPFPMQIGNIDAITFCLGLEDSFLSFTDEMNRLLMEALTLVDAEDESLTSAHKISEHRTSEQLIKLRVVCIKLLSLALSKPEFVNSQQGGIRIRILAVFFRTLCAKSTEIINASHEGLSKALVDNYKLPKELLQNGLRPMLMNLADHKKLTVEGLEALARLLELLISYFKVEIGKKLLDHLMAWASPENSKIIIAQKLDLDPTVQIIIAILNIFHLLPPKAYTYMDDIMRTLNYLEVNLRRTQDSPFRVPVAKFLNRFPEESMNYYVAHFHDRSLGSQFSYFIRSSLCSDLKKLFMEKASTVLFQQVQSETDEVKKAFKFSNFIELIHSFNEPEWLRDNKALLVELAQLTKHIVLFARSSALTSSIQIPIFKSIETLQYLFIEYFQTTPSDSDSVISLIDLLCSLKLPLSAKFEDYIFDYIVKNSDVSLRQGYLSRSVVFGVDTSKSLESRVFVFKHIINPILIYEGVVKLNLNQLFELSNGATAKPVWLDLIHNKLWRSSNSEIINSYHASPMDKLRLEMLQLTSLVIKYAGESIVDLRKDVIKFAWNFIKLEDALVKQAAYVVTCYFINTYDTPAQLVNQVFVALLRVHISDTRYLVRQSLDLLAPVMSDRMSSSGSRTGWIKWVRRMLLENNTSQNISVYQFIISHKDVFYVARDHFIPNIIGFMNKLTAMANPPLENQVLAVELAELLLFWEVKSRESSAAPEEDGDKMDVDGDNDVAIEDESAIDDSSDIAVKDGDDDLFTESTNTAASASVGGATSTVDITTSKNYSIPFAQRDSCIAFLARFICSSNHRTGESELGQRALHVFQTLLGKTYWEDISVKLDFFERFLVQADFKNNRHITCCLNALDVLTVVLSVTESDYIIENIAYIHTLLEKVLSSNYNGFQEASQRVLRIVLKAINDEADGSDDEEHQDEVKSFLTMLGTIVADDLQNTDSVAAGVTLAWTLANHYPTLLDPLVQSLTRNFVKICKDHITITQPNEKGGNSNAAANAAAGGAAQGHSESEAKITTILLEKMLYMSAMRISTLGDQRRLFLSLLAQLIDRSLDSVLLRNIIIIIRSWVFSGDHLLFPTVKEKTALLIKMLVFELRGELSLTKEFYQIIVDIFEEKSMAHTEMTVRLEQPFLVGTRLNDAKIRGRLMAILNESLEKDVNKRLFYVIREQNWEFLSEHCWLNQAIQLLFGSFDAEHSLVLENTYQFAPIDQLDHLLSAKSLEGVSADFSEDFMQLLERRKSFIHDLANVKSKDILTPLVDIMFNSPETVHNTWVELFPVVYQSITRREKMVFKESFVSLISKDYHNRQVDARPNVIQSLLEGAGRCEDMQLPPHLVKYLGYSFDAWYPALRILEAIEKSPIVDNNIVRETNQDALIEMYATLQEDDMFYGQWRRRAKYQETNAALSYEQLGLWDKAIQLYEVAQIKARNGALPYGESEYSLWEDNWILCAEKLQHWDILTELAKHESFTDLLLECGWRVADWTDDKEPLEQAVKVVMDVPTPRRQIFETFLCLQGIAQQETKITDLTVLSDTGIQLALRKWNALPKRFTGAHIPLLHTFQQYVEFMEASQIYGSLLTTTAQNLDNKSQELKRILTVWRERLPNIWDDINLWNDLVTWRQHAFQVINKTYMQFIPKLQQASNGNKNEHSFAYRGFHEIASVVNRFAHVARKHNVPEVCINQLNRIYTLPNIEIQEAFLKLREQAKCHYMNPNELNTGLDVISNTNLVYFTTQQKAEFFTLKGMFLSKMNSKDEANQAFATAVQIDLNLAKAWAEWGRFNDNRLKDEPNNISHANNAVSCYLQAAGLYKSDKARKLLARILWLISLDDPSGILAQAFDSYKGEVPVWYWITFIPQLLTSLSHKEASLVRQVLIKIAKTYPQALHFQLRTTREDFAVIQKQAQQMANRQTSATPANSASQGATPNLPQSSGSAPGTGNMEPWEYADEIMGILKTAYPLLALSLESLVDQIQQRFKCSADEDAYRLVIALLNDGLQNMNRLPYPKEDAKLSAQTEANIVRFAESVLPKYIRDEFEVDFIKCKPNLEMYVKNLRKWRDRLESKLDRRFSFVNLEGLCPHLSEFHHQKFEDIEVPGQYLLHKDNNSHFIKIERFLPTLELIRGTSACHKRLTIRGHDGSLHMFAIQFPSVRHSRREERIFQLYRILDDILDKKVQTRKRNIKLTLPIAVPLSPHIRLLNDSKSMTTMQEIYEAHCKKTNTDKDEPLLYYYAKMKSSIDPQLPIPDSTSIKVEIFSGLQTSVVPNTIFKNYFTELYAGFEDFWLFRKQFTSQYASFIFMTYMMSINNRVPSKILVNHKSGAVCTYEMLPSKLASTKANNSSVFAGYSNMDINAQRAAPVFFNPEAVPFRLTPNIQELIGEAGLEGILTIHILCIANALVEHEGELNAYLPLFIRDETISWYSQHHKSSTDDPHLKEIVLGNVAAIVKKVTDLTSDNFAAANAANAGATGVATPSPPIVTGKILELIQRAVNPRHLALQDTVWMAYL
ncbi:hypothetical protein WICPIJ_001938 [Wickerhamomyces pijperi]|uniref:Non-specific serine/threonine protein kinase n=1 Tax=Wickerhamomyces pijperi TaxID=599730 RepID=A0A9P8TQ92_WICPI|nr:hypothetical protein WICPIJ_001938 [Wickerhamomyces pijperi]